MLFDLIGEYADGRFQLRVLSFESGVRQVIDNDIRIDAVALDQPFALGAVDAQFSRGSDTLIGQVVARAKPDFAAPSTHADEFTKPQAAKALGECLAIGCRKLIAEHDHRPAKCALHVPKRKTV